MALNINDPCYSDYYNSFYKAYLEAKPEVQRIIKTYYPKSTINGVSSAFYPKQIIFNPPATIVFWEDGTKTIVKCYNEKFDEEKGYAMAVMKKLYKNRSAFNKIIENATRQGDKK